MKEPDDREVYQKILLQIDIEGCLATKNLKLYILSKNNRPM